MNKELQLGLDFGSTTAKVVLLDETGEVIHSHYRRHNADMQGAARALLEEIKEKLGNPQVKVAVTGSAGMGFADRFSIPFQQEVVAASAFLQRVVPDARTFIEIGGEDSKIIFYQQGGMPDIRMNGACAGGTGAFIDQMAKLLNISLEELDQLSADGATLYPISSRCGVFARTDVQALLSRGASRSDIAYSVFHSVAHQVISSLSRGKEVHGPVILGGGPPTFLKGLRRAFASVLKMEEGTEVILPPHPLYFPAAGTAILSEQSKESISLDELYGRILHTPTENLSDKVNRLPTLFKDPAQRGEWKKRLAGRQFLSRPLSDAKELPLFLGIDSGSTTTKMALIDEEGHFLWGHYAFNDGDNLKAIQEGLARLRKEMLAAGLDGSITGSMATGYGAEVSVAAFGVDASIVETMAHLRAARWVEKDVSFILDIGGQDIKAIFVEDGIISDIRVNEACSSGCGAFIATFAGSLGYELKAFDDIACHSESAFDLGSRCTVFMNSRVKEALRDGAGIEEIASGLSYSVVNNVLHKVLKISDTDRMGDKILVQGGTMQNESVLRALEKTLKKELIRPERPELMGALGAALSALDRYQRHRIEESVATARSIHRFVLPDETVQVSIKEKKEITCRGCENYCLVTRMNFESGRHLYSGNRCEKIYSNTKAETPHGKGRNFIHEKLEILFNRQLKALENPVLTFGIPRSLQTYDEYPFWATLLNELNFRVVLSPPSDHRMFLRGSSTFTSDNLCLPARLVHGHIMELAEAKVDRIFYPIIIHGKNEYNDAQQSYQCPVITGYSDLIRSSIDPMARYGIPIDSPEASFRDVDLLKEQLALYFKQFGIGKVATGRAVDAALAEWSNTQERLKDTLKEIIEESHQSGRDLVMLAGRPYHLDPMIHNGIPGWIARQGSDVITEDVRMLESDQKIGTLNVLSWWTTSNRLYGAARWVMRHPRTRIIQITSFGCGPDAISSDELRDQLRKNGQIHTVIKTDDIANLGAVKIRILSLLEAIREKEESRANHEAPAPLHHLHRHNREKTVHTIRPVYGRSAKAHMKSVAQSQEKAESDSSSINANSAIQETNEGKQQIKNLLAPMFSEYYSPLLPAAFRSQGYNLIALPASDKSSIDYGLRSVNNDMCYPTILVAGDVIRALKSGQYNLEESAILLAQTGGQCRASSYVPLLRKALEENGFGNVPVYALATAAMNPPGFDIDIQALAKRLGIGIVFLDALQQMLLSTQAVELEKGHAWQLHQAYLQRFEYGVEHGDIRYLMKVLKQAVDDFNGIPVEERKLRPVGIVGEIYVKYNKFANHSLVDWLSMQGYEPVLPSLHTFFAQEFLNDDYNRETRIKNTPLKSRLLMRFFEGYIRYRLNGIERIMKKYRRYRPALDSRHLAKLREGYVSLANQYGEGWLLTADIIGLVEQGVDDVICLQPFGCISNHITGKGVEKKLRDGFPDLNLLFLDMDAGASPANVVNRLQLFLGSRSVAALKG